jgi:hypothetical protein
MVDIVRMRLNMVAVRAYLSPERSGSAQNGSFDNFFFLLRERERERERERIRIHTRI